jgi:hypothetical protein
MPSLDGTWPVPMPYDAMTTVRCSAHRGVTPWTKRDLTPGPAAGLV